MAISFYFKPFFLVLRVFILFFFSHLRREHERDFQFYPSERIDFYMALDIMGESITYSSKVNTRLFSLSLYLFFCTLSHFMFCFSLSFFRNERNILKDAWNVPTFFPFHALLLNLPVLKIVILKVEKCMYTFYPLWWDLG